MYAEEVVFLKQGQISQNRTFLINLLMLLFSVLCLSSIIFKLKIYFKIFQILLKGSLHPRLYLNRKLRVSL